MTLEEEEIRAVLKKHMDAHEITDLDSLLKAFTDAMVELVRRWLVLQEKWEPLTVTSVCTTFRRNVLEGDAGLARHDAPEMLCRDPECPIHGAAPQ